MNTDFIKGVVVPILTIVDEDEKIDEARQLSLIHISEPTRPTRISRMPASA